MSTHMRADASSSVNAYAICARFWTDIQRSINELSLRSASLFDLKLMASEQTLPWACGARVSVQILV